MQSRQVSPIQKVWNSATVQQMILLFCIASFAGWVLEVIVFWISQGFAYSIFDLLLTYRGVLHGPWAPIYGTGAVLMVCLKQAIRNRGPVFFFFACTGVCAVIEYLTSWVLEVVFHARWWDYSGQFLNLNGRICALNLIFFGLAGMLVVYIFYPRFQRVVSRIPEKAKFGITSLLLCLFVLDAALSLLSPNTGLGVTLVG